MRYDPSSSPDPKAWLSLAEAERVDASIAAHEPTPPGHPPIENVRVHGALHAVVENQLASNSPPQVRGALERLLAKGLDRHQAVHAIGAVTSELVFTVVKNKQPYSAEAYARALDALGRDAPERV